MTDKTDPEIRSLASHFAADEIQHIIRTFGKRRAGGEGERKSLEYMADRCSDFGCAKNVSIESYPVRPQAFQGSIVIATTLILLASLLSIMGAVIIMPRNAQIVLYACAIVPLLAAVVMFICQTLFNFPIVDWLYPRAESHNMIAFRSPVGERKHRVIINANIDSTGELTFNRIGGGWLYYFHIAVCGLGVLYTLCVDICGLCGINQLALEIMAFAIAGFSPFWFGLFILHDNNNMTDGATGNLSGCAVGLAILKGIKETGIEFKNTEVGLLLTGSKNVGLRGSKNWCTRHAGIADDCDTVIITLDTLHKSEHLQVNDYDLTGVRNDRKLADSFIDAAEEVGVKCRRGRAPYATDCASFSNAGFRAISVTATSPIYDNTYHTRRDTIDNLNTDIIVDCYFAVLRTIEKIDKE